MWDNVKDYTILQVVSYSDYMKGKRIRSKKLEKHDTIL